MEYRDALKKAWSDIRESGDDKRYPVKFLGDEYEVDPNRETLLSLSCNTPAKDHLSIIILHYLVQKLKLKRLPELSGQWIDFRELEGGEGYYPAFRKRTIEVMLRKYAGAPDNLLNMTKRFGAKRTAIGDAGIIITPLENVPILITLWKADEEFGADANISFDKNISMIFCTEDIVVLTEILTHSL